MHHCIESAPDTQPSISYDAFRRAVDPEYGEQERHTDRQFEENVARLSARTDAELDAMLAALGEDDDVAHGHQPDPADTSAAADQSALTDTPAPAADDDDLANELPPDYRLQLDKLFEYSKGNDPKQKALRRRDARPLINYVIGAWAIDEITRENDEAPTPKVLGTLLGCSPAIAQNIIDKVRQFGAPGGPWAPAETAKSAPVSVTKRPCKRTLKSPKSPYATGDLIHSLWRLGWFRRTDEAVILVVPSHRRFLHHSRRRPPITCIRSPRNKASAPPPAKLSHLDLPAQAILAFDRMVHTYLGKSIDGVPYAVFQCTIKIDEAVQCRLRANPNALRNWRDNLNKNYGRECDRHGLKRLPIAFVLCVEEEEGLHIHGPVAIPVTYQEIVRAAMRATSGYWEPEGKSNRRGHTDVFMPDCHTTRGVGYGLKAAVNTKGVKGAPIAISRNLYNATARFYSELVAAALEYRATGKPLIPPKSPEEKKRDDERFKRLARRKKQEDAQRQIDRAEFIAEWRDNLAKAVGEEARSDLLRLLEDSIYIDLEDLRFSFGDVERALGVKLTVRELVARRFLGKAVESFPDPTEAAGAPAPARAPTGAPVSAMSAAVSGDFAAALSAETAALSAGGPKKAIRKRRRRKPTITPMIAEKPTTMNAPSYAGMSPFIRHCFEHIQAVRRGQCSLAAAAKTGDMAAAINSEIR